MTARRLIQVVCSGFFIASCTPDDVTTVVVPDSVYAGGETTIFSEGPDAYTFPLANLGSDGMQRHLDADGAFGQQFVTAPATRYGGLGPIYNQNSCASCHVRNGRGSIPQFEGDRSTGFLLRLSIPGVGNNGGIVPAPGFGGQLQDRAIYGEISEGTVARTEVYVTETYADGTTVTLVKPTYYIANPYAPLPADLRISPRNAPAVHGLGLLDAIAEADILANADENDADGDGISGKPNMVWDVLAEATRLGRFGWKAEQPTAGQQAADAAHNDMGLTNFYFPNEQCLGQNNCNEGLQTELDMDDETTRLMAYYFETLAVPAQRDYNNGDVIKGRGLFAKLNCVACHTPKHVTGFHDIPELANQTIYPYTDLLLHDMGENLSDNRPTYLANGNEWRTPPLWGIGLAQVVNPKATYLHDGRANTLEEAILWHGGEAENAKNAFKALSAKERDQLIAFLMSL